MPDERRTLVILTTRTSHALLAVGVAAIVFVAVVQTGEIGRASLLAAASAAVVVLLASWLLPVERVDWTTDSLIRVTRGHDSVVIHVPAEIQRVDHGIGPHTDVPVVTVRASGRRFINVPLGADTGEFSRWLLAQMQSEPRLKQIFWRDHALLALLTKDAE